MSLTSLLGPTGPKEIRYEMSKRFVKPRIKLRDEIVAPPLTMNYAGVGSAFDYLFRFFLERKYKDKTLVYKDRWVAENVIMIFDHCYASRNERPIMYKGRSCLLSDIKEEIKEEFKWAKNEYEIYINTGSVTDDLLRAVLFLGQLDLFKRRAGYVNPYFGIYDNLDIIDLKNLYNVIPSESFKMSYIGYLNPTFGEGSILVGGADADIIMDDTLVDVKVTKILKFKREYFNQLIGYYILSLIGGLNDNPKKTGSIKKLGLYFARHSRLISFPIEDIANTKEIESFKKWLIKYIKKNK